MSAAAGHREPEQRPRCTSWGHEALPAVALGIYDDGEEAATDVPYCADCARAMIEAGYYRATRVLDPDALGAAICQECGGAGRLPVRSDPRRADHNHPAIEELRQLLADFDSVPPSGLTRLFYAHAFGELRLAVDALIALIEDSGRPP